MPDASERQIIESYKVQMVKDIRDANNAQGRAMAKYKLLVAQSMLSHSEKPHTLNKAIDEALCAVKVADNDILEKIELLKATPGLWETFMSEYVIVGEDDDIEGEDDEWDFVDSSADISYACLCRLAASVAAVAKLITTIRLRIVFTNDTPPESIKMVMENVGPWFRNKGYIVESVNADTVCITCQPNHVKKLMKPCFQLRMKGVNVAFMEDVHLVQGATAT